MQGHPCCLHLLSAAVGVSIKALPCVLLRGRGLCNSAVVDSLIVCVAAAAASVLQGLRVWV